ncbi:VWA domain-containing protein [Spirochaeta thermophila]|uniref:Putative batA protein n=1 Tax=Winmispira thermophila (strain ATCC 49972 / DSM 6192 / RI 19.B1) TaxID=665571 RepID=E0RNM5_WINT6|nr:VWA domain-containing protein [Spirochaeta thermophila]ADN02616.1 putative batA protein [Spirochaeta thermophila DSM 6192]
MIGFYRPGALWLFVVLVCLFVWMRRRGCGSAVRFPFVFWGSDIPPGLPLWYRIASLLRDAALWGMLSLMVLILSGPYLVEREQVVVSDPPTIVIALDVSPSMGAMDIPGRQRFQVAREVIRGFVRSYPHMAVGLVLFGKEALLEVPPTIDVEYFLERLEAVRLFSLGDGTALGMGVGTSLLHLSRVNASFRAVVILTDGKNTTGEILPETAAEMARELGIPLFTVGVGSDRPVSLDVIDPSTGTRYAGVLEEGYDEETLRRIAEISGGQFFSGYTPTSLHRIFQYIGATATADVRRQLAVRVVSLHAGLLRMALLCAALWFLLHYAVLGEVL